MLNQNVLDELISDLKVNYKGIIKQLRLEHCMDDQGDYISLMMIELYKSRRHKGYGSTIMSEIINIADHHNVRIKLWVTDVFGTNFKALYYFYHKHNFFLIKNENDGNMIYYPCN